MSLAHTRKAARTPEEAARARFKNYSIEHPKTTKDWRDFLPKTKKPKVLGEDDDSEEEELVEERTELMLKQRPPELKGYPPKAKPEKLKRKHREAIKDYNLEVVGDDAPQAVFIAQLVKEGIEATKDICQLSPPVCKDNKGLTRDKMPQIEGGKSVKEMLASKKESDRAKGRAMVEAGADPDDDRPILKQMIDHLKENGVDSRKRKVPVGSLKATQKEIKAEKAFGMADSYLKNKFPGIADSVMISKDGYVLDGHHRWAGLMAVNPGKEMNVVEIDMDMDDLLKEAASLPGVYKADFAGNPLGEEEQKKYKSENKSKFAKKSKEKKASRGPSDFVRSLARLAAENVAFRKGLRAELRRIRLSESSRSSFRRI